jgi:hypothetical protein
MRISSAGAVLMITAALPFAVGGQTPARKRSGRIPLPLEGAQIFRSYCAVCHGTKGKGDGPAARRCGMRLPISARWCSPVWGPVFHEIQRDTDLGSTMSHVLSNRFRRNEQTTLNGGRHGNGILPEVQTVPSGTGL